MSDSDSSAAPDGAGMSAEARVPRETSESMVKNLTCARAREGLPTAEQFREYAEVGGGCDGCPFAGTPEEPSPHDPDEAHFPCGLLGSVVWGEDSPCHPVDWYRSLLALLDVEDGVLRAAAQTFRLYEGLHRGKLEALDRSTCPAGQSGFEAMLEQIEGLQGKIERNRTMAEMCERALADAGPPRYLREGSNLKPVSEPALDDTGILEGIMRAAGLAEAAPSQTDQVQGAADLVSLRLQTGDPAFDPDRPVTINGYLFRPAGRA